MTDVQPSQREHLALVRHRVAGSRRLVASWRRSEDFRVSLDAVTPAFVGSVDDESLFFESGHHVLTGLQRTLADEPVSLMLTDRRRARAQPGVRRPALLTALDDVLPGARVRLSPNAGRDDRARAGARRPRRPSLVRGEEHYCTGLWGYTCAAAPVEDPDTGDADRRRQPHDLVAAVLRSAAGAGRRPRPATPRR